MPRWSQIKDSPCPFSVFIGPGCVIDDDAVLGYPPNAPEGMSLQVGAGTRIRSGAIVYLGSTIGSGCHIGHNAVIRERNHIGNNCSIGTGSVLEPYNKIGDGTRVHSLCSMEHAVIGSNVFIGPGVRFLDDAFPRGGGPCREWIECKGGVTVHDGAIVCAASVLVPGVTIGYGAVVGAGALVYCDVGNNMTYAYRPEISEFPRGMLFCGVHKNLPYSEDGI